MRPDRLSQSKVFGSHSLLARMVTFISAAGEGLPAPQKRRARILSWILLTLIFLLVMTLVEVFFFTGDEGNRRSLYMGLLSILLVVLLAAFELNRRRRYRLAAGITVAASLAGPWGAVLLDRFILQGDYIPLIYTTLSLFLCSILLNTQATMLLAGLQFTLLLALSIFLPNSTNIDWPSLLAFIMFTSVLSLVSNILSREDLNQIDRQNSLLGESEAHMRELSVRDVLTGLYNRRFLEETLPRLLQEAAQTGTTVGLVMVDVDFFKRYNDSYGHVEGDTILHLLGAAMRTHIRKTDVVCRYGGEEFVILLPGASLEVTRERAEQLRREANLLQLENAAQLPGFVTLSMGVALFPLHGSSATELLRAADVALYRAKDTGRDRVVVAADAQ